MKDLHKETKSFVKTFGRLIVGGAFAKTGWFADDYSENRKHYIIAVRVIQSNENAASQYVATSITVGPLYVLLGWKRGG